MSEGNDGKNVFDTDLLGEADASDPVASTADGNDAQAAKADWDTPVPQGTVPSVPQANTDQVTIDFVDSTADGSSNMRAATESAWAGTGGDRGASTSEVQQQPGSHKTTFWQLAHYRSYFDVDTKEVAMRMLAAIAFRRDFFAEVEARPDLYGPFWLCTSAVFLMAMIGNALDYSAQRDKGAWEGDLQKVVSGAAILYGYVFGGGGVLWFWLKVVSLAQISLSALWCIYGYSMAIWIPGTLLALVPNALVLWCLCLSASFYSGVFLVLNLKQPIQESLLPSRQAITLLLVFLAHQLVGILLRVYVFSYTRYPDLHGLEK